MNIKCSVYIAASVDGFIARTDGDIEWLHKPEYENAELVGLTYEEFIKDIDAIVMGRHSFEKVRSFGFWPYKNTEVVVLSRKGIDIPDDLKSNVRVESGNPIEIANKLSEEGKKHLYIDGGLTIQEFLKAGLIEEIIITRIPILLGAGIPLFNTLGIELSLELVDATTSDTGFVQVRYRVLSQE